MSPSEIDYVVDRLAEESREYSYQARINRDNGMEPSDAYWRGRAQGLQDARDLLLNIRR